MHFSGTSIFVPGNTHHLVVGALFWCSSDARFFMLVCCALLLEQL